MEKGKQSNILFRTSHMTILLCYTLFCIILTGESILLGWEAWAIILIIVGVLVSWMLHIQQKFTDTIRLWIYSILMMGTYFFYGIHPTSTYDLATVMGAVLIIYTMTGETALVTLCEISYYVTMGYSLFALYKTGYVFESLEISRTMLHLVVIFIVSIVARTIIEKWREVMGRSWEEVQNLKDATNRLNDFLANVSHEIRTPVNAVIGLAGVCYEKESDDDIKSDLQEIKEAGKRVADQISDILDYSEIDGKRLAKNYEDYMLTSVLHDLVTQLRPYKNPDIEMIIDVDPAVPSVMNTDVSKLKKILWHLCMNGMKYTKEGGVYVRIYSIEESYGINLCVDVRDTGIGMSEEEVEKITEGFYQANSGRARSSSGLGLGMSIVNGFVFSLGGFMSVESELGKGTTVHLSIPQKVVDPAGCMSLDNKENLCIGAYLHFEKYENPNVREYYNVMVRNIVRGLGVQMHWASNLESLKKLHESVKLTHLFVGPEEYESDPAFMEEYAKEAIVVVVANAGFPLPKNSCARIMEKPFYCFPVAQVLNMTREEFTSSGSRLRFNGVEALVVDDEPMNLTVAKGIFRQYGMKITTCVSGFESIDLCSNKEFDIVFMDHMMPGMDGVEAMKRIRSIRRDLPIVALTANAVSTAREMFMKEGFDGFVSKPIELAELERVMKAVLPASKYSYEEVDGETSETKETKVEEKTKEPEIQEEKSEFSPLREAGIDEKKGLHYCQDDPEFYRELLAQYATESDEKLIGMKKFFAAKDFPNYTIIVHALKSTSKMIGAMDLSRKAKNLEDLSKAGGSEISEAMNEEVFVQYGEVVSAIKKRLNIEDGASSGDDVLEFGPESDDGGNDDVLEFGPETEEKPKKDDDDVLEFAPEE